MAAPAELERVVEREAAVRLLVALGRARHCEVGVFGPDGKALRAEGALAAARPAGVNGTLRVEGAGGASVSCVTAFDRVLGYVVARADREPSSGDATLEEQRDVAEHGAAVLGELCCREYELNDLSREILGSYEELNVFYELAGELAGAPNADAVCRVALAKACGVIQARAGWILLADTPRGDLRVAANRPTDLATKPQPPDAGVAGRVLASGIGDLVDDVRALPKGALAGCESRAERSLLTVALSVPGVAVRAPIGVLQLRDKTPRQGDARGAPFTAGDLKLAQAIATQAAVLIQNSRLIGLERELHIARDIQESLLPGAAPRVTGLDVAGTCLPASNVGGDYFDFVTMGDGSLAFLVADVSGHNLAAALLQTATRTAFRAALLAEPGPAAVLRRASRTIHDDLSKAELFLTAWLGCIDPTTGELRYSDAGHNPAILRRAATGETRLLATGGIPIGVDHRSRVDQGSVVLEPGDLVVAYTDGVTEACVAGDVTEQFGESRLAESVARAAHLPAAQVVDAVLADVERFSGGPSGDDRSLVVVRFQGPAPA